MNERVLSIGETVETIVMSNLGYFQLKASAGVWQLRSASGRSSRVYEPLPFDQQPHRHEFAAPLDAVDGAGHALSVLVTSLVQQERILRVRRLPGSETLSLLDYDDTSDDDAGGLWNRWFGGSSPPPSPPKTTTTAIDNVNTVHVFSLASGHLYERFLRIMMLSVKRTLRAGMKVKFWFVRQFLSPTFKRSVLDMAAKYDFEVELVSYKWPSWLRRQTEKQRIIWGYKILFLDVLFPLGLHRIIFIDADQVVRSDITQLWKVMVQWRPFLGIEYRLWCMCRWTCAVTRTRTRHSATRTRPPRVSGSGRRAFGRSTCATSPITSARSTSSTCASSGVVRRVIRCVPSTTT